jgi:hypothetical protein
MAHYNEDGDLVETVWLGTGQVCESPVGVLYDEENDRTPVSSARTEGQIRVEGLPTHDYHVVRKIDLDTFVIGNADKLDGKHADEFLLVGGTAVNADKLDNQHGAYYLDCGNATGTLALDRFPTGTNGYVLQMGATLPDWAAPSWLPLTGGTLTGGLIINQATFSSYYRHATAGNSQYFNLYRAGESGGADADVASGYTLGGLLTRGYFNGGYRLAGFADFRVASAPASNIVSSYFTVWLVNAAGSTINGLRVHPDNYVLIPGGLNVGSATGATTGSIKASGDGSFTGNLSASSSNSGNVTVNDGSSTFTGLKTFNPTGTVPFVVNSSKTDRVQYLNCDMLDGYHGSDFPRKTEANTTGGYIDITGYWRFYGPTVLGDPWLIGTGSASSMTVSNWAVSANGKMGFGADAGSSDLFDTHLYRVSAGILRTEAMAFDNGIYIGIDSSPTGTNTRFKIDFYGVMSWGEGNASSYDTTFFRRSSGTLETANLYISGNLTVIGTLTGTASNADKVDNYHAVDFPRKAENATISGTWTFGTGTFQGTHKSSDGTSGLTDTKTFYTTNSGGSALYLNTVTIKNGLITAWTIV